MERSSSCSEYLNFKLGNMLGLVRRGKRHYDEKYRGKVAASDNKSAENAKKNEIHSMFKAFFEMIQSNSMDRDFAALQNFLSSLTMAPYDIKVYDVFKHTMNEQKMDESLRCLQLYYTDNLKQKLNTLEFLSEEHKGTVILGEPDTGKSSVANAFIENLRLRHLPKFL